MIALESRLDGWEYNGLVTNLKMVGAPTRKGDAAE